MVSDSAYVCGSVLLQILGDIEARNYQQVVLVEEHDLVQADSTISGTFVLSESHTTSLADPAIQIIILSPWTGVVAAMSFRDPANKTFSYGILSHGIEYEWSRNVYSLKQEELNYVVGNSLVIQISPVSMS